MKVLRKDRWVELRTLEPGQRFRFKSADPPQPLFQVCKVSPRCNWVTWNRDTDGYRYESDGDTLVEHVKGHWVPEEELVEMNDADEFEFEGDLWQREQYSLTMAHRLKDGARQQFDSKALVRVVHGAFVEDGAKIEETES